MTDARVGSCARYRSFEENSTKQEAARNIPTGHLTWVRNLEKGEGKEFRTCHEITTHLTQPKSSWNNSCVCAVTKWHSRGLIPLPIYRPGCLENEDGIEERQFARSSHLMAAARPKETT